MLKEHVLTKAIRAAIPCFLSVTAISLPSVALSQEATDESAERIIITGSRGAPRSVSDSAVPVDILSEEDISGVPFTDTNDVLKTLVPSFSLNRQPISDGAAFIRPAKMRGLPSDKVLVLVNSKRRHRAALVEIGNSGTQGPDLATVPAAALKTVEILRDGAAAQYGSDAIAGVINLHLKDNDEGGSVSVHAGQYYEGDGEQITVTGNIGLPLGDSGFFSLSGEISDQGYTERAEQYCENWACVDPNDARYLTGGSFDTSLSGYSQESFIAGLASASLEGDVVQPWGQPNASAVRVFFNSGYELNNTTSLYAYGNYSDSESDGSFFYRYPGNGTIEDLRLSDGSLYSPLEKFPGGFTPRFFGDVTDISILAGVKGEFDSEFTYDFSARFGSNEIDYRIVNTINPSMGPDSPTEFEPGALTNEEFQLQADFVKFFDMGFDSPLTFAFGLSYMDEAYVLDEGDEASYTAGDYAVSDPHGFCNDDGTETDIGLAVIANGSSLDCSNDDDPVYRVVGVGSNGFPGYSPEFSDDYERDSTAAYIDMSTDLSDTVFVQGAMRYENYSDFDPELVWKLATQIDLSDDVGMRASVGTGFRAPTPGQQGTTNVSTRLPNGFPVATGLFPASGVVAQALGAEELKPETSVNYTLGLTADLADNLNVTLDLYRIELSDRFYAISTLDVSTDPDAGDDYANFLALQAAGVVGAESIGGVFYFQNAFDTITQGFDLVITKPFEWSAGSTMLTASFNYNEQEFDSDPSNVLNLEDKYDFIHADPEFKGVFSVKHTYEDLTITARANYYGSYTNSDSETDDNDEEFLIFQEFDPEILFDLEATYQFTENLSLSLGARNLFDEYPDESELDDDTCCGRIYRADSEVDWQGGYYYLTLRSVF